MCSYNFTANIIDRTTGDDKSTSDDNSTSDDKSTSDSKSTNDSSGRLAGVVFGLLGF